MTPDEATAVFSSYSMQEKKWFLAQLMHELTIVARDSYVPGGDDLTNPQRVRRINEVQHRLSSFLRRLLTNDPELWLDDAWVRDILEQPHDEVLSRQLLAAFERVHRLTATANID